MPQALSLLPARRRFGTIDGPVRAAPRTREAAVFKTCGNGSGDVTLAAYLP
jgi:hypothetical protein